MLLVVGLGNPGARYERTRHNVGFMVLDHLAGHHGLGYRQQFQGEVATLELASQRLLLLKPQTFMNRSGSSVRAALGFYKIPLENLLVVHDELDLPFTTLRLKVGGGEAGHNGLRSISRDLGSRAFARLRFGVGRPPPDFGGDGADYVLQAFAPEEALALPGLIEEAADAVIQFATLGAEPAMNRVNRKKKEVQENRN